MSESRRRALILGTLDSVTILFSAIAAFEISRLRFTLVALVVIYGAIYRSYKGLPEGG